MSTSDVFEQVAEAARARGFAGPGKAVVVAASGGADSTFLLHALVRTGASLHVAHLHHGLRGERADDDARFVADAARSLGLPATIGRACVPEVRRQEGGSIEEVARRVRYAFLAEVARTTGASRVALGHTADDQAETVLFRILRGTGIRGLRGMPRSRPLERGSSVRLVRPLLRVRRRDIEAALVASGIAWREDETNADLALSRNWIRRSVLPALASSGRDPVLALLALGRDATRAQRALDAQAARSTACARRDGGPGVVVDAGLLSAAGAPTLEAIVRRLADLAGSSPSLGRRTLERLGTLLAAGARTGASVPLGGDARATREGDAIRISAASAAPRTHSVLRVPGETQTSYGVVSASIEGVGAPPTASGFEAAIDADRAGSRLEIGPPRAGDRLRPLGALGGKPLRRLLTDWKVPAARRPSVPVLRRDDGSIVWVAGHRIADDVRVTGETRRVLRLSLRHGETCFSGVARSSSSA